MLKPEVRKRGSEVAEKIFDLLSQEFKILDDDDSVDSFMLALEVIVAGAIRGVIGRPYEANADYFNTQVKKLLDMME